MADRDELDFKSSRFNPARALSSPDIQLPDPNAEEFDDLYSLRETVHSHNFNVARELPGVLGPGGIPRQQVRQLPAERRFTADQGLIRGRGRRRVRNVISRMEDMAGPLALLSRCRDDNARVKVYTRNHSEVRGVLTGYVVAFDKHWNLALRDVDEVFQKKLRCKAPALGDVSGYVKVDDLSIHDSPETSDDDEPRGKESRGGAGGGRSREEQGRVTRKHEATEAAARRSVLVDKKHPGTSEAQDARRLELGRDSQGRRDKETKRNTMEGDKKEVKEDKETETEEEEMGEIKKRKRKRKKREIRKRHVNQLLVRGENVVLISVVKP
ncbi:U7 snRNA-associated Sm-like protein LSm11 [Chionoecetes opilio]|uniref:U7 snRNA-associated Sm-like protein LSm11 n=1 Tax=Chionoecetes opilio TaxID=41210 RepID=A0A8J5CNS8_CHIOP|nr:U7 snRNA-associated Sm-like protein LSm11 [Chionoecetes opilio]